MEQGGEGAVWGLCGDFGDRGDAGRWLHLMLLGIYPGSAPAWLHQVAHGNPCWPQGNQCWGAWQGGRQLGVGEEPRQSGEP